MTTSQSFDYGAEFPPHAYLQQLARAKRFLDRYRTALCLKSSDPGGDWETVDDLLWTFFQHCWHVKDWLKNDLSIDVEVRTATVSAVHRDQRLLLVADLANGAKHFLEKGRNTGARDCAIQLVQLPGGGEAFVPLIRLDDGHELPATAIAKNAMAGWRELLVMNGLAHFASPD